VNVRLSVIGRSAHQRIADLFNKRALPFRHCDPLVHPEGEKALSYLHLTSPLPAQPQPEPFAALPATPLPGHESSHLLALAPPSSDSNPINRTLPKRFRSLSVLITQAARTGSRSRPFQPA